MIGFAWFYKENRTWSKTEYFKVSSMFFDGRNRSKNNGFLMYLAMLLVLPCENQNLYSKKKKEEIIHLNLIGFVWFYKENRTWSKTEYLQMSSMFLMVEIVQKTMVF